MSLLFSVLDALWEILRAVSVLFLFGYLAWAFANAMEIKRAIAAQTDHMTGCVRCGRKQFKFTYWREDGAPLCNLCGRDMEDADRRREAQ